MMEKPRKYKQKRVKEPRLCPECGQLLRFYQFKRGGCHRKCYREERFCALHKYVCKEGEIETIYGPKVCEDWAGDSFCPNWVKGKKIRPRSR